MKNRFRVFLICIAFSFSFNFIPSRVVDRVVSSNDLSSIFTYVKTNDVLGSFIVKTEIAKADVGIGTLTAGGLAFLEGVLMPYVLGGLGVAGFLYGDTKFRQAESNIRRWAQVSADVATQLNQIASKKNEGDTVSIEELPQGLIQKMTYELGKVNYDGSNIEQFTFASVVESTLEQYSSSLSVSSVLSIYNSRVKPILRSGYDDCVFFRITGDYLMFMTFDYDTFNVPSPFNRANLSSADFFEFSFSYPSYSSVIRSSTGAIYEGEFAPLFDFDLGRVRFGDITYGNSVSFYPPSRTKVSDGQSISVPTTFPVSIPLDGTWERDGAVSIPIPTVVPGTDTASIPIEDTQVIPHEGEDTGNPSIPGTIPSDWTVPNKLELDFSPLYLATNKFPFCLPFDFYDLIKSFETSRKAPVWNVSFDNMGEITGVGGGSFSIDFGNEYFSKFALIFRTFVLIFFCIFLAFKTKSIMGW